MLSKVAAAHNVSIYQVMYTYVRQYNITVLSSYDPKHPEYTAEDLAIFDITLSDEQMTALDDVCACTAAPPKLFTASAGATCSQVQNTAAPLSRARSSLPCAIR